uniref:Phosphotransferase n=1 Tax=Macrostomum lignano TaxID=282301 RepID=A0A1I8IIL7_9PLAT
GRAQRWRRRRRRRRRRRPRPVPGPGDYLALDLGGTNYRVLLVRMRPPGQPPEIVENVYSVPGELMRGRGIDLFDFLAATIADFMAEHGAAHLAENPAAPLRLGFTFSFPCEQRGLASARLLGWTKGYSAEGVVGNDVCQLLQEAIDRRGLAARCVALVNDTVGTLAACALEDPACMIGLIVGTGTNAAYVERVAAVDKYSTELPAGESRVVINTEWGNFGADGCLERFRTDLDRQLDAASINPGRQTFEKLVSGMYLGELVRLAIQQLVSDGVLFDGRMPEALRQPMSFHTKYLSEPAHCGPRPAAGPPLDMMTVRCLCEAVSTRSAYLVATGISCLLKRIGSPDDVTVGIDGSLFKFHPHFPQRMIDKINELHPDAKFLLRLSEDGSGKGAAAIAAMA